MVTHLQILKELKQLLISRFGEDIIQVILFGSQISGHAHKESDYDIIIVLKNDYNWQFKDNIRDVCYDISIDNEIFLDIKVISVNELQKSLRGRQPLFTNAIRDGVYI